MGGNVGMVGEVFPVVVNALIGWRDASFGEY
jgi:hypothetical protein